MTDVGLLLEPVNMEKYDYIRLEQREQWVVAMHPDAPLAKLERITPNDLKGLPLVLPHRLNVQSELAGWFGDRFDNLNILFTANLPSNSSPLWYITNWRMRSRSGDLFPFWDQKNYYRPLFPALTATSVLHGSGSSRLA